MRDNIYREDSANLSIDIPGGNQHVVSAQVLFKQLAAACKGGLVITGGRTTVRMDADGRVFVNGQKVFEPRGIRPLATPEPEDVEKVLP